MACNIQYKDGKIINVLDDSGNPSKLYKDAVDKFGEEKGLEMYLVSKSNSFLDFFADNQEPTLQEVTNYVASNNRTEAELNQNQKADLINVLISNPDFKAEDFYDEFGMFVIPKKHYSRYELLTLENEEQIKEAVDALLNTDFTPNVEVAGTIEQINEKNAFGKLVNLNPNISEKEKLREQVLNGEREDYKTAEVFLETLDGELISAKNTETEQILPLVVKETFKTDLVSSLETFSLSTLQQGEEQTRIVLKAIENDLISQGIDAIGLSEKPIDEELVGFLNTAKTFINSPTKENTKTFAEKSDIYFERDLEPKVYVVKSDKTDRNYVKLNTNLPEEQLYEKKGLIQSELGKGIYIQTAKESLEDLYNNLRTYTEKYTGTLEQYVQEQISEMNYDNAENAEAIFLYKMYFGVGQNLIKDKNGNLLAPNGKISNLNEEQWKLVRTPEFISWFGAWQNEPQNASKVVDENGEPLVVYHGTNTNFTEFNTDYIGKSTGNLGWFGIGNYFTPNKEVAKGYGINSADNLKKLLSREDYRLYMQMVTNDRQEGVDYNSILEKLQEKRDVARKSVTVMPIFLNIKNPIIEKTLYNFGEGYIIPEKNDGVIAYNNGEIYEINAPKPNQIKSATEIKGVINEDTNDIRYLTKRPQYNNATKQFVGNYNYLTEDYVSDFYIEQLKEKKKNSAKYRNFYKNFEVNEKGINLLNIDDITMQQIEIYADDNLRQYSLISKQMPNLRVDDINENQRDLTVNNPQTLEDYKKDLFRVNDNTIILKDNIETFVKVNGEIYENVETDSNLSVFAKIETEKSDYYQYNIKQPKTNIKLSDYNYLATQEELFTSPKKYLKQEEKNQIKNDNFNC